MLCSGLASPARFECAAFRLGGECSILLSYGDKVQSVLYPIFKCLSIQCRKTSGGISHSMTRTRITLASLRTSSMTLSSTRVPRSTMV